MTRGKTKKNNNSVYDDKAKEESLRKEYEIKFQMIMGLSKRHLAIIVAYITLVGTSYAFLLENPLGKIPIAALNIILSIFMIYWLLDTHIHFNVVADRLDVISTILGIGSYYRKKNWLGKTELSILICIGVMIFWIFVVIGVF